MKGPSRTLTLATGWILALIVGFLVGRGSSPSGQNEAQAPGHPATPGTSPAHGPSLDSGRSSDSAKNRSSRTSSRPAGPDRRHSTTDAIATLRDHLRIGDPNLRTRRLLTLLDSLDPDDFEAFTDAFRKDDLAGLRDQEYKLILGAWVGADPLAAVAYLSDHDESGSARRHALRAWAALDPRAAFDWIQDKEDVGSQNDWYVGAIGGIASNDPTQAFALLESLPPGRTRSASLGAVAPHILQNGFEFTTDWVAGITDESLQAETARYLADDLTEMNPVAAGRWVANMSNTNARRDASEEVSDQWARSDLEAAREWVETLPPDTITEGAEGVVRHMARQDPERAAQWINSIGIDPGTNRDFDGTRRILLSEIQDRDPELALENVYTLTRQSDRDRAYYDIVRRWTERDQNAARAWVAYNASALPQNLVRRYGPPTETK